MKYIVFLRGINVGGRRKIKMADLRALLTDNGFENVKTYIQSGNVFLEYSAAVSVSKITSTIASIIFEKYGFDVKVVVKTVDNIQTITDEMPQSVLSDLPLNRVFAMLLDVIPEPKKVENLLQQDFSPEVIVINKDVVYFSCPDGISKSKLNNNFIEKKLGVSGTTRNYKTIKKLLTMV